MDYFVTNMFFYESSAIEIAEVQRLNLFKAHHRLAKIVTLENNRFANLNVNHAGVATEDHVNLFNYFQHGDQWHGSATRIKDLVVLTDLSVDGTQYIQKFDNGAQIQYYTDNNEGPIADLKVDNVAFRDANNLLIWRDFYDQRGFLSWHESYGANGNLLSREFFDPNTSHVILTYRFNSDGINLIQLSAANNVALFANEDEFKHYFFEQLDQVDGPNYFMIDRSEIADNALFMGNHHFNVLEMRHTVHTTDPNDPVNSDLIWNLQNESAHLDQVTAYISATQLQADDIGNRLGAASYAVPVSYLTDIAQDADAHSKRLILIARIHPEKRIEDGIKAFAIAHQTVPELELDIWGYVKDQPYYEGLQALIQELDIDNHVHFKGFTDDLSPIYRGAKLNLNTSFYEGFGMAMMEGMGHGVPNIAYRVNYGPRELVQDGQNGLLVENGDIEGFARAILQVITNPTAYEQLSDGAIQTAQHYNADANWAAWEKVFTDLRQ